MNLELLESRCRVAAEEAVAEVINVLEMKFVLRTAAETSKRRDLGGGYYDPTLRDVHDPDVTQACRVAVRKVIERHVWADASLADRDKEARLERSVDALLRRVGVSGRCSAVECSRPIYWVLHRGQERPTPYDPDGTNHFVTCPVAERFRKKPRAEGAEGDQGGSPKAQRQDEFKPGPDYVPPVE